MDSDDDWMNMADDDEEVEITKAGDFDDEEDVEIIKPEFVIESKIKTQNINIEKVIPKLL